MTEDAVRQRLDEFMDGKPDLTALAVVRLRRVYLELPETDAMAPTRVRDALVWHAELWGGARGARIAIDDRSGKVLAMEYL